jgi:hypothetical protein
MTSIREQISTVREALRGGKFMNEASVCTGIVHPLLHALDWPVFTPEVVFPEFMLEGRRVDYALCHRHRPVVFIEVKQPVQSAGADRQLFEYAFHKGIPMAVLTDGQEWHFYLPGEQGDYQERRVYKLDLVERDMEECERRFRRYLSYDLVCSGEAVTNARSDYQSIRRQREAEATLPAAWLQVLKEQDGLLIELLSDQVESLCGYRPEPDTVSEFLSTQLMIRGGDITAPAITRRSPEASRVRRPPRLENAPSSEPPAVANALTRTGFELLGQFFEARNGRDAMIRLFQELDRRDGTFLERFAALPKHGKRRRFVARAREDLYPGRPDLARDHSYELRSGWWIGTNFGQIQMNLIIEKACDVAGLRFGSDVRTKLD